MTTEASGPVEGPAEIDDAAEQTDNSDRGCRKLGMALGEVRTGDENDLGVLAPADLCFERIEVLRLLVVDVASRVADDGVTPIHLKAERLIAERMVAPFPTKPVPLGASAYLPCTEGSLDASYPGAVERTPRWVLLVPGVLAVGAGFIACRDLSAGLPPVSWCTAFYGFALLAGLALVADETSNMVIAPIADFGALASVGAWNPSNLVTMQILFDHRYLWIVLPGGVVLRRIWIGGSSRSGGSLDWRRGLIALAAVAAVLATSSRDSVLGFLLSPGVTLAVLWGLGMDLLHCRGRALVATSSIAVSALIVKACGVAVPTSRVDIPDDAVVRSTQEVHGITIGELASSQGRRFCSFEFALLSKGEGIA